MDSKDKCKVAKEYLLQVRHMYERIQEKNEIIEELRARLILPARKMNERVQGSKAHDTFEQKMAVSLDEQMDLSELVFKYELFRDDILMMLLNMEGDSADQIQVLYYQYLRFMPVKDIVKALGISSQSFHRYQNLGLEAFYDQYLSGAGEQFD